jgi:putative sterol carrier protein
MPTPQELFDCLAMRLAARPGLTAGLDAAFQFDISGPAGGTWHVKAVHGDVEVGRGPVERPTITARMSQAVLQDIATGTVSGQEAFSSGRIRVEGEATLEVYLGQFFGA